MSFHTYGHARKSSTHPHLQPIFLKERDQRSGGITWKGGDKYPLRTKSYSCKIDKLSLRCFTLDVLFCNYSVTKNFVSPILDGFKHNCSIIILFVNLNRGVLQQLVLFFPIWFTFWKCIAIQYSFFVWTHTNPWILHSCIYILDWCQWKHCFLILSMFYLQLAGNNEPVRVTPSTFSG